MIPIDVQAADLLHKAGFSLGDFAAMNARGRRVHVVTADGPLGSIRAEGASQAEAWGRARMSTWGIRPAGRPAPPARGVNRG